MPATIQIPPHQWFMTVAIEVQLLDNAGNPYPGALTDNTALITGRYRFEVDPVIGHTLVLPCNDEIPVPPNQSGSSQWGICVHQARTPVCYRVAIHSGSPPTTWNELIGAAEQVDADHIFTARLLPVGALAGQFVRKSAGGEWEAVDPPSGVGDVVGPVGAVDGNLAVFSGVTGKTIADGGPVPTAGVSDHGALTGLGDDDHAQYHTDARGDARYEQIDATLLRQADVQDTPGAGDLIRPPSANWAATHESQTQAHGISAFGEGLVSSADAAAARSHLDAQETITEITAMAGF